MSLKIHFPQLILMSMGESHQLSFYFLLYRKYMEILLLHFRLMWWKKIITIDDLIVD